ncbi:hypothetical protein AVEN_228026-1 [Araneus ventricosus]|uniref:Uncharacterized protein n=1 Tax=Araneus ventricosus TaxID=182803 RepID=A0A4Y2QIW7_ARAVE|nr:hypothetical protein AVEN_48637-1 [Araneus ventricosus]GBN63242.1 hypothetical protein AVEN_256671-1 [Araneus ventricosus]GBN69837.1 hypothetical protein AVEN_228026-1 [Araneus ventricosus]
MYGENSPTSRKEEIDTLFSNIPENTKHRQQEKQHFHKLATQTDSNSLMKTAIALRVKQLTKSQDSGEILRTPKTFKDDCLISATPGFLYLS